MRQGRKHLRRRLRRRQLQRTIMLLAPTVLTITCLVMPAPAPTHAMLNGGPPVGAITFRSLSSDDALLVDTETLHITVTEDVPVGNLTLLSVTNTSGRTLHLTTTLAGVDDLRAHSSSVTLLNGSSADVWLTGKALAPGFYTATLTLSAMNGYLQKQVTLEATVLPKKSKPKMCRPGTDTKVRLPAAERPPDGVIAQPTKPGDQEPAPPVTEPPNKTEEGSTPAGTDTPAPEPEAPTNTNQPPAPDETIPAEHPANPGGGLTPALEPTPGTPAEGVEPPVSTPEPETDVSTPALDPNVDWVDCGGATAPAVPPAIPVPPSPATPSPATPGSETPTPTTPGPESPTPVSPTAPEGTQPQPGDEQKTEPKPTPEAPSETPATAPAGPPEPKAPLTDETPTPGASAPAGETEPSGPKTPTETADPDQSTDQHSAASKGGS